MYDFKNIKPKAIKKPGKTDITNSRLPKSMAPVENPGNETPGLNFWNWLTVAGAWLKNKSLGWITGSASAAFSVNPWLLGGGIILIIVLYFTLK